jgi:hypothetical protein
VSMAVVATISALVLGLLISNANTSFIARSNEVRRSRPMSCGSIRCSGYMAGGEPSSRKMVQFAERKANDLFTKMREMSTSAMHLCTRCFSRSSV